MRFLLSLILLTPFFAHAAAKTFADVVDQILEVIGVLVPFIFGLTLLVLIWGIVKAWIINAGDEAEIARGRQLVTVGIVVLVIMSGVWGILAILKRTLFG